MLMSQNRDEQNLIEVQIGGRTLILPMPFIRGLLMFISLPNVQNFDPQMLEIIKQVSQSFHYIN